MPQAPLSRGMNERLSGRVAGVVLQRSGAGVFRESMAADRATSSDWRDARGMFGTVRSGVDDETA